MPNAFQKFTNRLFDPGSLSDENVGQNRQMANLLLNQVSQPRPLEHPTQGLAILAQALNAQAFRQRADRGESALKQKRAQELGAVLNSLNLDPQQQQLVQNLDPKIQQQVIAEGTNRQLFPESPTLRDAVNFGNREQGVVLSAIPGSPEFNAAVADPNLQRIGPVSQVQRQETGGVDEFSGTRSQKFKKQDDFRTSVVNTSLAIDKATDLAKIAIADPASIGNPGAIASFANEFTRTSVAIFNELLPGEDLSVDYGPDDMDFSSFSGSRLRELASNNAQFRASVFSIAFAAAVAEQGSRPSDKDVEGKIKEIAGDSSDVLSFVPTLRNFVKNIDERVRKNSRVGGFNQSFLDSVLPELDRSMSAFDQTISAAPAVPESEVQVLIGQGLSREQAVELIRLRKQHERQ